MKVKNNLKKLYIILVNKDKNIFKFGRTGDIRSRLRNYANGTDSHPDIKFIMLVKDNEFVENCVKGLIKDYQYKDRQEIYKIDIELIKKHTINCASLSIIDDKLLNKNMDSYIIFNDIKQSVKSKKRSKKSSKK
jgi:hypothetical protein